MLYTMSDILEGGTRILFDCKSKKVREYPSPRHLFLFLLLLLLLFFLLLLLFTSPSSN